MVTRSRRLAEPVGQQGRLAEAGGRRDQGQAAAPAPPEAAQAGAGRATTSARGRGMYSLVASSGAGADAPTARIELVGGLKQGRGGRRSRRERPAPRMSAAPRPRIAAAYAARGPGAQRLPAARAPAAALWPGARPARATAGARRSRKSGSSAPRSPTPRPAPAVSGPARRAGASSTAQSQRLIHTLGGSAPSWADCGQPPRHRAQHVNVFGVLIVAPAPAAAARLFRASTDEHILSYMWPCPVEHHSGRMTGKFGPVAATLPCRSTTVGEVRSDTIGAEVSARARRRRHNLGVRRARPDRLRSHQG